MAWLSSDIFELSNDTLWQQDSCLEERIFLSLAFINSIIFPSLFSMHLSTKALAVSLSLKLK